MPATAVQIGGALTRALAATGSERGTACVGARFHVSDKLARGWGGQVWGDKLCNAISDGRCALVVLCRCAMRDGSQ